MIRSALLQKYVRESWGLLAACGLGLLLFGWMFVYMICQFDTRFLEAVFRRLPDLFEGWLPVPIEQLASFSARLALVYDHPLVILLMVLWCVARSSDVVAGELDRGTLELLLAQPVRRSQLLWSSTAVTLSGIALLTLLSWLGMVMGIHGTHVDHRGIPWPPLALQPNSAQGPGEGAMLDREGHTVPLSDLVHSGQFAPAAVNYFCLGVFLCGLGTLCSSLNRYRWRTIGLLSGFLVMQLMVDLLGKSARPLGWIRWFTCFYAYDPAGFVIHGLRDPRHVWSWWQTGEQGSGPGVLAGCLVLLLLGGACLLVARHVFERRDIPAPL